jgi:predicted amidohydrolase YtcJ
VAPSAIRREPRTDPEDLTEALPDNPAYVQYLYEHATVNDKGIEALNLHDPASLPEGTRVERDRNGQPTGKIFGSISSFSALFEKITELEYDQRKNSLRNFFTELNRVGVTGVVDPAGGGSNAASYDPLFALWREKDLSVRVAYRVSAQTGGNEAAWFQSTLAYLPPRLGDEMLKFLGLGELLVFGVNDGVQMGPGFAPPQEAREELFRVSVFAAQRRYPVEIHAYTNDAAQAILEVFERVATVQPLEDLRWSITHINTGTQETFDRMKKLGLAYTVQMGPYFEAPMIKAANGAAVAETAPPIQLALNAGLMVAGGTDSTRIGVFNTWRALEYYVIGHAVGGTVRRRSDLLLSRLQALRLFTANAAWMTFDEDHRGSLETGKLADLVVLDRPYLAVPENEIHKLGSVLTLIDGIVVYASDEFAHLRGR